VPTRALATRALAARPRAPKVYNKKTFDAFLLTIPTPLKIGAVRTIVRVLRGLIVRVSPHSPYGHPHDCHSCPLLI
jgi:hypothetical protein